MSKVLFVITGVDYWTLADGTRHPSGFWAEEFAVPYQAVKAAGHQVVVATPGAVVPTADQRSLSPDANGGPEQAAELTRVLAESAELHNPVALSQVRIADYDAVFYPGGHGPMEDLAVDPESGELLTAALESGKPVAVLCHGPAALLAAAKPDGGNAFAGYTLTGFSNTEEELGGLASRAKWLLQDRLEQLGGKFQAGEPWASHVVVDRNLVSGQNPASSAQVAAEILKQLD